MSAVRERPSQVTIVVVLIWIAFALTVVGAIATILVGTGIAASDPARVAEELKNLDLPESWSTGIGPIIIVAGALMFVVAIIQEYFNKDRETATQIMLKVHRDGKGMCGVYPKDIASTKVELVLTHARKAGHPLQCVMEEA